MKARVVLRALRSWRTARSWLASFLVVLGILEGAISLLAAFFPAKIQEGRWRYLLIVVIISITIATARAWPRSRYSKRFAVPNTQISIVVGDLFEQDGHLVIGMSDTFDTETPRVISSKSVQGQFLQREYADDRTQLDADLVEALQGTRVASVESRSSKPLGKLERYGIGTVAVLGTVKRHYFCVAYASMSNKLVAQATVEGIWTSLANVWKEVRDQAQLNAVSIPVVGSGLARLSAQLSNADLVRLIAISFLAASRERIVTRHLQIVIHPRDAEDLDLQELAEILAAQ